MVQKNSALSGVVRFLPCNCHGIFVNNNCFISLATITESATKMVWEASWVGQCVECLWQETRHSSRWSWALTRSHEMSWSARKMVSTLYFGSLYAYYSYLYLVVLNSRHVFFCTSPLEICNSVVVLLVKIQTCYKWIEFKFRNL